MPSEGPGNETGREGDVIKLSMNTFEWILSVSGTLWPCNFLGIDCLISAFTQFNEPFQMDTFENMQDLFGTLC